MLPSSEPEPLTRVFSVRLPVQVGRSNTNRSHAVHARDDVSPPVLPAYWRQRQ
jgi:hypothetical protein